MLIVVQHRIVVQDNIFQVDVQIVLKVILLHLMEVLLVNVVLKDGLQLYTGKCKDLKANGKYLRCYDKCPNGDCRVGPYLDSCISCQENYENTPGLLRCFCLRYDGYDVVAKYNGPCQSLIYKDNELQCPPCPANNCRPVQVIIFKTVVIVLMKMVH